MMEAPKTITSVSIHEAACLSFGTAGAAHRQYSNAMPAGKEQH